MPKPYTFLSASPKDGLYIADVVHALRDRGYDVTAQQLRDYEKAGLFTAEKTQGGFRVYSKAVVANIEFVYVMKLTGMSLRDIKEF